MNKSELDAKRDEIAAKVKALVDEYSDIAEVETATYDDYLYVDIAIYFTNIRRGESLGKKEKELRRKVFSLVKEYKDFAYYSTNIESDVTNFYVDLGINFINVKTDEYDKMIKEFESSVAFKNRGTTYLIRKADYDEYFDEVIVVVDELDDEGGLGKSHRFRFNIGSMKNIELIK